MALTSYTFKNAAGAIESAAALDTGGGILSNAQTLLQSGVELGAGNPLPVSATALPLPSGAATAANQATEITGLTTIAASVANIPSSPATAVLQGIGNTSLSSIQSSVANIPVSPSTAALQNTGNTSLSAIATSVGNIPAAPSTAALQSTGNTSLATIATAVAAATPAGTNLIGKFSTDQTTHGTTDLVAADITKVGGAALLLGQGSMTASIPVTTASDQTAPLSPDILQLNVPTITASSAYAANNCIGGLITITNAVRTSGGCAWWDTLKINDKANQRCPMLILIFNASPTASTFTDKTAYTLNTADFHKCVGKFVVAAGDYDVVGAGAIVDLAVGRRVSAAVTTLYAAMIALGTPTYASTSDIQLGLGFSKS